MNWLDIVIVIPLVWGAYQGYKKGFVIELASLAALILGIYAAIYFSYYIAGLLGDNTSLDDKYINITAFILTFILVVLTVYFIGRLIEKFIDILMLSFINRVAGIIFGIFKWAFLLSILIFVMDIFDEKKTLVNEETRKNSIMFTPIASFAPKVIPRLNIDELEDYINKKPGNKISAGFPQI